MYKQAIFVVAAVLGLASLAMGQATQPAPDLSKMTEAQVRDIAAEWAKSIANLRDAVDALQHQNAKLAAQNRALADQVRTLQEENRKLRASASDAAPDSGEADNGADASAKLKRVIAEGERQRLAMIKKNEAILANTDYRIPDHEANVEGARRALALLRDFKGRFVPETFAAQVGTMGHVNKAVILQVVDDSNMLVTLSVNGALTLFWVQGVSTEGLVDGRAVAISNYLEVTGTKQYQTSKSNVRTVFLAEPMGIDEWFEKGKAGIFLVKSPHP